MSTLDPNLTTHISRRLIPGVKVAVSTVLLVLVYLKTYCYLKSILNTILIAHNLRLLHRSRVPLEGYHPYNAPIHLGIQTLCSVVLILLEVIQLALLYHENRFDFSVEDGIGLFQLSWQTKFFWVLLLGLFLIEGLRWKPYVDFWDWFYVRLHQFEELEYSEYLEKITKEIAKRLEMTEELANNNLKELEGWRDYFKRTLEEMEMDEASDAEVEGSW